MQKVSQIEIIVVGDPEAGKTSFLKALIYDEFSLVYRATVIYDKFETKILLESGEEIQVVFHDFSGQPIYSVFLSKLIGKIDHQGCLIVTDVMNPHSLSSVSFWVDYFRRKDILDQNIIVLLSKVDFDNKTQDNVQNIKNFMSEIEYQGGLVPINTRKKQGLSDVVKKIESIYEISRRD